MNSRIYIIASTLIALMACGIDTPQEPEIEADFTAEDLIRFIDRDANASSELIGQTSLKGAVWRAFLDVSPPYFTLRASADIQVYLLDESIEIHQQLLTRQTDVVVQGVIESFASRQIKHDAKPTRLMLCTWKSTLSMRRTPLSLKPNTTFIFPSMAQLDLLV